MYDWGQIGLNQFVLKRKPQNINQLSYLSSWTITYICTLKWYIVDWKIFDECNFSKGLVGVRQDEHHSTCLWSKPIVQLD